jgi:hypothetical protein
MAVFMTGWWFDVLTPRRPEHVRRQEVGLHSWFSGTDQRYDVAATLPKAAAWCAQVVIRRSSGARCGGRHSVVPGILPSRCGGLTLDWVGVG